MNLKFGRAKNFMTEFGLRGKISDENSMIHILNNLPVEYDVIFDSLENYLMSSGPDALTIEMIHKK